LKGVKGGMNDQTFLQRLWIVAKSALIIVFACVIVFGFGFLLTNYQDAISYFFHLKYVTWTILGILLIILIYCFIRMIWCLIYGLYSLAKWLFEPLKKQNK
jgi:hypothetical protein